MTTNMERRYDELKLDHITETVARLQQRIAERFPNSGLSKVAGELLLIAKETGPILANKRKPHRLLQLATAIAILLVVAIPVGLLITFKNPDLGVRGIFGWVQLIESLVQDAVFLGVAIWFLVTAEARSTGACHCASCSGCATSCTSSTCIS